LEIVVEHPSMANQTHLLRSFHGGGSDYCATRGAKNLKGGFRVVHIAVLMTNRFAQLNLPDGTSFYTNPLLKQISFLIKKSR
jgi:hypothetical protein